MPVNPGLTRAYVKMRCSALGGLMVNVDVAPDNSLVPQKQPATETNVDEINQEMVETMSQVNNMPQSTPEETLKLSGEQMAVLYLILHQKTNVFFTGAAGTGKSVLLRYLISRLRENNDIGSIAVTATTGIAACNIGGQTLHRFAGVGLAKDSVNMLCDRIRKSEQTFQRWRKTKYLIIDEVSMLPCDLLEKLEAVARNIRNSEEPFGGIQLVFTGDLFQLPPVEKVSESRYCFETDTWRRCIDHTINLSKVFRQSDPTFSNMLNEMRIGKVSAEADKLFRSLDRPAQVPKGISATQLFSTRNKVNEANNAALNKLDGPEYQYTSNDTLPTPSMQRRNANARNLDIDKHVIAEKEIKLKVGAQVMLNKNLDNSLVNGSLGRVVAFVTQETTKKNLEEGGLIDPFVKEESGSNIVSMFRKQEEAKTVENLMGAFGDSPAAIRKRRFAESLTYSEAKKKPVLPVVRFPLPDGTKRLVIIRPEKWEITDSEGEVLASRVQIPLQLAWALSIHKSQGQTLPYVSVNLRNIFAKGQAYVAVSRATNLAGLQVLGYQSSSIRADERVVKFYSSLGQIKEEDIIAAQKHHDMYLTSKEEDISRDSLLSSQSQAISQPSAVSQLNNEPELPVTIPEFDSDMESETAAADALYSDPPEIISVKRTHADVEESLEPPTKRPLVEDEYLDPLEETVKQRIYRKMSENKENIANIEERILKLQQETDILMAKLNNEKKTSAELSEKVNLLENYKKIPSQGSQFSQLTQPIVRAAKIMNSSSFYDDVDEKFFSKQATSQSNSQSAR